MSFELEDVVPWGRSFGEYLRMFALTEAELSLRILGCGDGPASFNAIASRHGCRAVSADPLYRFGPAQIAARIKATAPVIAKELRDNAADFVWTHFESVEELVEARLEAMNEFLGDYPSGRETGRYVDAALPELPFRDDSFDLALCSHFLFLYSEGYDADFHVAALQELARVAAEVRVFPLLELAAAPSRHLGAVTERLRAGGYEVERQPVAYEFQKGGNEMLRIRRR